MNVLCNVWLVAPGERVQEDLDCVRRQGCHECTFQKYVGGSL